MHQNSLACIHIVGSEIVAKTKQGIFSEINSGDYEVSTPVSSLLITVILTCAV